MLHPVIKANYGKWKYHTIPKPGVLMHVAESGDKIYTVRAASARLVSIDNIRRMCDLADKYCDGFFRYTSRNNVEFMTDKEANVEPLIADLKALKIPVGGTGHSISNIVHTQAGCTATAPRRRPPAWSRPPWTNSSTTSRP
jgi:sulfite reductase beta subunit